MINADAMIRADHMCSCVRCDITATPFQTDWYADGEVLDIRRDRLFVEKRLAEGQRILIDGRVVAGVYLAILGEDGFVWRYRNIVDRDPESPRHICVTCKDRIRDKRLAIYDEGDDYLHLLYGRRQVRPDDEISPVPITPTLESCSELLRGRVEFRIP